jgi:hypothetical protein
MTNTQILPARNAQKISLDANGRQVPTNDLRRDTIVQSAFYRESRYRHLVWPSCGRHWTLRRDRGDMRVVRKREAALLWQQRLRIAER